MSADDPWHRFIPSTPTASEVECYFEVVVVMLLLYQRIWCTKNDKGSQTLHRCDATAAFEPLEHPKRTHPARGVRVVRKVAVLNLAWKTPTVHPAVNG